MATYGDWSTNGLMMAENRTPPQGEILFYSGPSGTIKVEVLFEGETFWLSQRRMAELFGVDIRTINEHLQNIYETNELDRLATVRKFRMVQQEGGRDVDYSAQRTRDSFLPA